MFIKKKALILLLTIILILIGASNVFAQEEHDFEAYFGFYMGIEGGFLFEADEDQQAFNWGFISRAFDDNIYGLPQHTLYLFLYFNIYDGDFDTGEGAIAGQVFFDMNDGEANHPLYWPGFFVFFDMFGSGNDLYLASTVQTSFLKNPYDPANSSELAYSGLLFAGSVFDLGMGFLIVRLFEFHNNGISERDTNDVVFDPYDNPDGWSTNRKGRTILQTALSSIDLSPITLDANIGFEYTKSQYISEDEKLDSYTETTPEGSFIIGPFYYGSYLGYTDDERAVLISNYELSASFTVTYESDSFGTLSFYATAAHRFQIKFNEAQIELEATIDKLVEDLAIDFSFVWMAYHRDFAYIEGDTLALQVPYLPFRTKRFEIVLDASYTMDMGIYVIPNINLVVDLADLQMFNVDPEPWSYQTNPYAYLGPASVITENFDVDPHNYANEVIPWSFRFGIDLGLGGNSFQIPIYIRLSNIPTVAGDNGEYGWNGWLDSPYNYQLREISESLMEDIRLFFGIGIQAEF